MMNSANQARGREFWRTRKLTAYSGRLAQADDIQHLPLAAATSTLWYSSDIIKSRMYPRATPTHRFICSLERLIDLLPHTGNRELLFLLPRDSPPLVPAARG